LTIHTPTRPAVARSGVPWTTVVPLAVAIAFADGFWIVAFRGAVGSIERTQGPFASWLRESALSVPVFSVAVLCALTLALRRWGGPGPSWRSVAVAGLLVVGVVTGVAIAVLVASSLYDYVLQAGRLHAVGAHGGCATGDCVATQEQASLALQTRAIAYGAITLLVTNLVVVGWVAAARGGRPDVVAARVGRDVGPTRFRGLLVAALVGAGSVLALAALALAHWPASRAALLATAGGLLAVAAVVSLGRADRLLAAIGGSPHSRALALLVVPAVACLGVAVAGLPPPGG
jgi:hypothetical protein